ncbi:adhesion G-protein coupled receptor G7 [Ochotona princeps]|uniref:adhesion G-protein coupled receptor G7 n=1 Tax=Ochotona princeps TaxID=9978 RepID=UPI0027149B0A|nr:adhesion G-protein coupled receptor G7 [Ochotona princeps]
MVSCRAVNLRLLVVLVFALLVTIILGLAIWRVVIRINGGSLAPPSSVPIEFCQNGGTWENGRCVCTEEWKGWRCTIANFCENSTYMGYTFARIPVGRYGPSLQTCGRNTSNAGSPLAIRLCGLSVYGEIELQDVKVGNCDENLETLEGKVDDIPTESENISNRAQILTSDASKLTAENITSAAEVVGQIFNASRNAAPEAKRVAVTTVSQLLDVSEEVFQEAAADAADTFATLIEQMENYSLSLDNESVVEPNVVIQSVNISSESSVGSTSILFSVLKGTSDSLVSGSTSINTNVDSLNPSDRTELQVLLNTTKNAKACGFVVYQNSKFFQSKRFTTTSNFSQRIVSCTTDENEQDQSASVEMVFSPKYNQTMFQLDSYACVYWNFSTRDWDTYGCHKDRGTEGFLQCRCNHTTNFAVLMSFRKNYNYPESLNIISNIGCALSIAGLAITIIFQIVTRKVRKTSITWVLVSLCTSMLIFNLLFVFGIENSNKNSQTTNSGTNDNNFDNTIPTKDITDTLNSTCTAVAILLHYFLLATFTWNALSATQLYFLLIRTMKPLPRHFILSISLTGWGVPAIIVAITVGVIYSQNSVDSQWELDYRQEEFCWLAIPDDNDYIRSPFLWSFILPMTIILIGNLIILIIITVKVLWKNNQNLTSTKTVSSIKRILSTLSIAVIFGITWILAYFMLIEDTEVRLFFNYVFCLFNTTQGLQIFILYTVRTKIFMSEASKVWTSLSSSMGRMKPSVTQPRLRMRMYNMLRSIPTLYGRFRLLEPSEDIVCSEEDLANSSI